MEGGPKAKRQRRANDAQEHTALAWLLGAAATPSAFLRDHWEHKPLHARRDASRTAPLFCAETLLDLAERRELRYERDLNVVNCPDGRNKQVVHDSGSRATAAQLRGYLGLDNTKKGSASTVQFFQPQRYVDELWHRMADLEAEFSSLWGANVYLTAGGTQGLAPHFDDVEVFVLQMTGTKRWKVHGPSEAFHELATECSGDLEELGELLLDVELAPGDLLYLPRGTTHYAVAGAGEPSVHITISTYQKHTWHSLLDKSFTRLVDAAASTDIEFRRGLPVGYLWQNGTWRADPSKVPNELCSNVARLLRRMADALEEGRVDEDESVAQALHEAVDSYALDFIANRLPRPGANKVDGGPIVGPEDVAAAARGKVRLADPRWLHVAPEAVIADELDGDDGEEHEEGDQEAEGNRYGEDEEAQEDDSAAGEGDGGIYDDKDSDDEEEEEDTDDAVRVFTTVANERELHMGPAQPPQAAAASTLGAGGRQVLDKLRAAYPKAIPGSALGEWLAPLLFCGAVELDGAKSK